MLQLCRKSWAERKNAGELDFSVCRAALHSDAHLMRQAEDEYDLAYPGAKGGGKQGAEKCCYTCRMPGHTANACPKGGGKGGGAVKGAGIVCHNCKQPGHKKNDCPESSYKKSRGKY